MRSIFLIVIISCFLFLASANPNPVPIQNLSLTNMTGTWYNVWESSNICYGQKKSGISYNCSTWLIDIVNNQPLVCGAQKFDYEKGYLCYTAQFKKAGSNSVWLDSSYLIIIDADLENYSWFTIGSNYTSISYIFSRTPNLSSDIINKETQLLQSQGFNITYQCTYPNEGCEAYGPSICNGNTCGSSTLFLEY